MGGGGDKVLSYISRLVFLVPLNVTTCHPDVATIGSDRGGKA